MWEDLRFRAVSPLLCLITIICAISQGGAAALLTGAMFSCLLIPAALKEMIGFIDIIFLGIYFGLLADGMMIGHFCFLTGGLGILWTALKKTQIPLMTMMGASYSLIINIQ